MRLVERRMDKSGYEIVVDEWAMCRYHLVLEADAEARKAHPTTVSHLRNYFAHACSLQNSMLLAFGIVGTTVHLMISLDPHVSIEAFVTNLKVWTTAWITSGTAKYWIPGYYTTTLDFISDTEMAKIIGSFASGSGAYSMHHCYDPDDDRYNPLSPVLCHHIIFNTSRNRLLLRLKFKDLLTEAMKELCGLLGCQWITGEARRNHVHMICLVPALQPMSQLVEEFKDRLFEWMLTNPHFRSFPGWSGYKLYFTVSPTRLNEEESDIVHQDQIHTRIAGPNEMYYLNRRLGTQFNHPLN